MELIIIGAIMVAIAVAIEAYEHRFMRRYYDCRCICPKCLYSERNGTGVYLCTLSGKPVIKTAGTWKCRCWNAEMR